MAGSYHPGGNRSVSGAREIFDLPEDEIAQMDAPKT